MKLSERERIKLLKIKIINWYFYKEFEKTILHYSV